MHIDNFLVAYHPELKFHRLNYLYSLGNPRATNKPAETRQYHDELFMRAREILFHFSFYLPLQTPVFTMWTWEKIWQMLMLYIGYVVLKGGDKQCEKKDHKLLCWLKRDGNRVVREGKEYRWLLVGDSFETSFFVEKFLFKLFPIEASFSCNSFLEERAD